MRADERYTVRDGINSLGFASKLIATERMVREPRRLRDSIQQMLGEEAMRYTRAV